MEIRTNTAERKTTKRHICRSSYDWLSKLTMERLIFFVKIFGSESSSNFSRLQMSTATTLKQKNRKRIPGFRNTCTSEDPQAMKNTGYEWTNLFYRYWEVHSEGECGQPAEKKTTDQNLLSNSQIITKKVQETNLLLSCWWKIQSLTVPQTFVNWKCQQLCSKNKST